MSLTPTELQELQSIVATLSEEFPHNQDLLWDAAIRLQKGDLGPTSGSGGVPAFEAAVADIKTCQDEVQDYQGRTGSPESGFDVAVLQVVPPTSTFPSGNVGDIIYLDTAPNSYLATDQIQITPAGPNSVQIDEVGTTVARSVPAASGGMEVNNLSTGAGFERVLTTSDSQAHNAEFVTMSLSANIPNERVLTAGLGMSLTDGGAGGLATLDVDALTLDDLTDVNLAGAVDNDMLYRSGGNWIDTAGAVTWDASIFRVGGGIRAQDGNAAAPGYTFNSSTTTGFYRSTANEIGFSLNGVQGANMAAAAFQLLSGMSLIVQGSASQNATLDWASGVELHLQTDVTAGDFRLSTEDGGSVLRTRWFIDGNTGVHQIFDGSEEVARTNSRSLGGWEIFQSVTGPGSSRERVYSTSDRDNLSESFTFSTTTNTGADPGIGAFRMNNATPASVTEIAVNDTMSSSGSQDFGTFWGAELVAGDKILIKQKNDPARWIEVELTGVPVDQTGFWNFPVSVINNGTLFQSVATCEFQFSLGSLAQSGSPFDTPVVLLGDINTATPPTTEAITAQYQFFDLDETDQLGLVGYDGGLGRMFIRNMMHGGGIQIQYENAAGSLVNAIDITTASTVIRTDTATNLSLVVNSTETAVQCTANGLVGLYHNNIEKLQTTATGIMVTGNVDATQIGGITLANLLDSTAAETITDLYTFSPVGGTGAIAIDHAQPKLLFNESGLGADLGNWLLRENGADLGLYTATDAAPQTIVDPVWVAIRGATTAVERLDVSPILRIDAASPILDIFESDAGVDEKSWYLGATSIDRLILQTRTDAGGAGDIIMNIQRVGTTVQQIEWMADTLRMDSNAFYIAEAASANSDVAGFGQLWVETDTPNRLKFTDDSGQDFDIAMVGGYISDNVTENSSFNFNTAGNFAANRILYYDDGTNNTITLEDSTSTTEWPVYTSITVIAPGSGVQTITEGSGTTLFLQDGTDTVGGGSISQGAATIFRASTTDYIYIGDGFTT